MGWNEEGAQPRKGGAGLALASLVLGSVVLGSSPIFVRLSEIEPLATAFYRVALAAPALSLLAWATRPQSGGEDRRFGRAGFVWLCLAGAFFAADLAFLHRSLHLTSIANATLFLNFAPFFLLLGRWLLFGERVTARFLASLIAALGGVALLVGGIGTLDLQRLAGDAMALLAGAFYGAYLLVVSRLGAVRTSIVMAVSTTAAAALLLPVVLLAGESLLPRTASGWLTLATLALVTHAGGQGLLAFALKLLPAASSSAPLLIQPVAAACAAWLIFGEALAPLQIVGAAIVLLAILACHRSATQKRRDPAQADAALGLVPHKTS